MISNYSKIDIDKENNEIKETSTLHPILFQFLLHYISLTSIILYMAHSSDK